MLFVSFAHHDVNEHSRRDLRNCPPPATEKQFAPIHPSDTFMLIIPGVFPELAYQPQGAVSGSRQQVAGPGNRGLSMWDYRGMSGFSSLDSASGYGNSSDRLGRGFGGMARDRNFTSREVCMRIERLGRKISLRSQRSHYVRRFFWLGPYQSVSLADSGHSIGPSCGRRLGLFPSRSLIGSSGRAMLCRRVHTVAA